MAEKDKDENIPIKEQDDGSVLAKVNDLPEEFGDDEPKELKDGGTVTQDSEHNNENDDSDEEKDDSDAEMHGKSDEEREQIREARREERRLKKELKKQREISAKHKITTLEKRNEELARRLAQIENNQSSFRLAQLDKTIEDEATRIEYLKMKMLQSAQINDAASQIDYLDQLTDAKQKFQQLQHFKKQQLDNTQKPVAQNVPNPISSEVQQNATRWLKKNSWYDPEARDTDSRIAKVIDQDLASEGWDPSDSEYWDELDNRLSARLPHRYTANGKSTSPKRGGPTASSRVSNTSSAKPNTITLSRERVQAIKDAGAWDDPERRNKMIRAYASYDRTNKG
jgi:hypothetical protein